MGKSFNSQTRGIAAVRSGVALAAVATVLALPSTSAHAQQRSPVRGAAGEQINQSSQDASVRDASSDSGVANGDIVVTGTILRGAPPVGSNLVSIGEERLQAQGATTSNELLATVPQVSNLFNNVPNARLSVASSQIQVVRPNLRNLSPETSSSASTLVMFDGHRIASVGVTQNAVDPDIIPAAAIERVEVVTDGGSSTYGSDAVGGVINFIIRKRFDGVKVSGRYGIADDYRQVEASAIAGKDWGSGSLFAAYTYQHNDALFGRDRDFIQQINFLTGVPVFRSCSPGNVQIGTTFFPIPSLNSAAGPNACDESDDRTFVPSSTRHGALGGLHQELADWLTVDARAFYGERRATSRSPFRGQVTVTGGSSAANPRQFYYTPVPGQNQTANQTVFFTFAPLLGRDSLSSVSAFQEWGANVEFKANIGDNWAARALFNYSRANSTYNVEQFNQTLLNAAARGTTAATAINFYNPSATDLALIGPIINSENAGQGKDGLLNARLIVDGTLVRLPGGDVKVAAGYEHLHDTFQQRVAPADRPIGTISTTPFAQYDRSVDSFFGEVQVPVFGEENRLGFIHTLTLAGSVRYDRYSDFGSTTNPKVGFNFKPISWLGFRGNYSTSFNAPSPVDQLGALRNTALFSAFNAPFVRPGDVPGVVGIVSIQGANPGLRPQTAKTYSFGVDIDPPFLSGLHASVNYYNVKFKDIIRQPSPNNTIYTNFPGNIRSNVNGTSLADIQSFLAEAPNGASVLNQVLGRCNTTTGLCNVYTLIDFRTGNYGRLDIEGLDFAVNYRTDTSFGGIDAGLSGNYQLKRQSQTGVGAPVINEFDPGQNTSRLQLQATLGADVGSFRAQATLNHTSGYRVLRCDPTTTPACLATSSNSLPQDRTNDFNTVNLFFKYALPGDSPLFRDLEFTLNVNNVFDADPPVFKQSGGGTINGYIAGGFTIGRMVQIGVSKKF